VPDLDAAKRTLLAELREHSLVIGEVTLSSGAKAQYYVDARRALLRPAGFRAAGELIAAAAMEAGANAVGGPATAAIPPACAALAVPAGSDLVGFFVRGERKQHGLQRWVEGPVGEGDRVLVVEDTVTSGGSTVKAIERVREQGLEPVGTVAVVDRLAGGGEAIEAAAAAPYRASSRSTSCTRTGPTAADTPPRRVRLLPLYLFDGPCFAGLSTCRVTTAFPTKTSALTL
jgi:orotate phosphoribosyltransferase